MRIHNIIKTVCLAGSLALLSACEDWLEIEPKDRFGPHLQAVHSEQ